MPEITRIIKRYANRKLYDTHESCYVTLDQIAEFVRHGEDVRVVDNATKEDLTSVTLAQIILEGEKRQRSFLPLSAMRKIIQSGGESLHDLVNQIQESAGRVGLTRVFRREDESKQEEQHPVVDVPPLAEVGDDDGSPESAERKRVLRDFIESVQTTVDDWQKRVDSNFHSALESVSPLAPLQREIRMLHERIAGMEKRLSEQAGATELEPGEAAPSDSDGDASDDPQPTRE